jgi:DNA end-binding protein Ku
MSARAFWQGVITIGREELPVKFFSAVRERAVQFHLLHAQDHVRLQQRLIDPRTHAIVDRTEVLKGYPIDSNQFVLLDDQELDQLSPSPSRKIEIDRFVPEDAIPLHLFERPYYLGPVPAHEPEYYALAQALATRERRGIARWVMRKRSYAGVLCSEFGYLLLVTIHDPDELISPSNLEPPSGRELTTAEKSLAGELVDSMATQFEPEVFQDTYQAKVRKLVEAKLKGRKPPARRRPKVKPKPSSLVDALRRSIRSVSH